MCGAKEILWKNVRDEGNPIEKCAGPSPGPRKSWKKPHNLSPILAPAPGTPGNPGKNLTICGPSPGPPEILEKTSQFAPFPSPRPRDLWKSWKNLTICGPSPGPPEILEKNFTILRICLLVVVVVVVVAVGYISGGEALLRRAILTKSADMQI